ncbi:hypothetical protein [Escherichia sp. E5028]|uniref:hypothetical protein n=1 Tax=Escherichia sp. E5028 TaxID=2044602 RepID=UPI001F0F3875|nr:hypothetical protein [Escherichia sp. E5028]
MKIKINKKEKFYVYIKNRKTFGITQEGMKTTLLCSLISATLTIQPALGAKMEVTLSKGNPAEISENIIGADGVRHPPGNDDGEAGEDALIVNVVPGSLQDENILTINSGTRISGGEGGWAGDDDVTKMGSAGAWAAQLLLEIILLLLIMVIFPVVRVVGEVMVMAGAMEVKRVPLFPEMILPLRTTEALRVAMAECLEPVVMAMRVVV